MKLLRTLLATIHAWVFLTASVCAAPPNFTSYRALGSEFSLEWTGNGLLQSAESASGPWETISGAASPFSAERTGTARFYRLVDGLGEAGIHDITALDEETLRVTFDREMGESALIPGNYLITGEGAPLEVKRAKFKSLSVVDLTTTPQSYTPYQVTINNLEDSNGQQVFFEGRKVTGNPKGAVVSAGATSSTRVVVAFNEPMADNALAPQHYVIKGPSGNTLPVTDADFDGPLTMVVVLTTGPQANVLYTLNAENITDLNNDALGIKTATFQGIGFGTKLARVVSTDATHLTLTFSGPVGNSALSPSSYLIEQLDASGNPVGTLQIISARFLGDEKTLVELTTKPQLEATYRISTDSGLTDPAGNPLPVVTLPFQGIDGAKLSRVVSTDATHLVLTFSGPVGNNALSPSSYLIEQIDTSGNPVGTLQIVSARFVGDDKTLVELTTEPQSDGSYRISTNGALTDPSGNPLPVATISFAGISGQPALAVVAWTGPTSILLTFNVAMSDDVLNPAAYLITELGNSANILRVLRAIFVGTERRVVELTTEPQQNVTYVIQEINVTNLSGTPLVLPVSPTINVFTPVPPGSSNTPIDPGPPRVVGAASLNYTNVIVAFSEPMGTNALRPEHYVIVQENVNSEAAYLRINSAKFYSNNPATVILSTWPQNEVTYRVTAVNVTDSSGVPLAPKVVSAGVVVDSTSALFPGTPPTIGPDSDGDGLIDNVEMRGWIVTVRGADGTTYTRVVTSDPENADTDGDGLNDYQEANLRFDPRNVDTDDDQLNDYAEFNEIYSNGLAQDTDEDGLDDFLEFAFFLTSPIFGDTDGDQIQDGDEIIGSRNPRVSDLPRPEISIGEVSLRLNVRFSESRGQEQRDLQTKTATTTLTSSSRSTFTRSDTINAEFHLDAGYEPGGGGRGGGFVSGGFSVGYTFQQTAESEEAMQKSYERSLTTDEEVTKGFTLERNVEGAVMQVAVSLRNVSTLAYRVKNLQVTAFIQDPLDHSRLTPVATLVPQDPPDEGYTLGPLVTDRGPFIFENATIVPTLVETLMANSSGLVFRISNYDIIDEHGRNFAFTGQEIIERTARLVIDYGGASSLRALIEDEPFDEIRPGDETEIHRVATSAGRPVADTNDDGKIDRFPREIFDANGEYLDEDYPIDYNGDGAANAADETYVRDINVVFDTSGKLVGIGLHQAMAAIGLVRYSEATTPTDNLSEDQILNSYSTVVVNGREKIFRIRGISNDSLNKRFWEILTPLGVDHITDLNDLILKANTPVSLNFVQDLDGDGLTADVEYLLRTSDSDEPVSSTDPTPKGRDTDKDGLDDRYEALIGWDVFTPVVGTYRVWSSPTRKDSNFDDPAADPQNRYDGSDAFAAPDGWDDANGNKLRDRINEVFQKQYTDGRIDYILDPIRRDTDGDGINDAEEVAGFDVTRITNSAVKIFVRTNPVDHDSDKDTFSDGFERQVGLDPTNDEDVDTDSDGLPDPVEDSFAESGWLVTTTALSTAGFQEGATTTVKRQSSSGKVDTDDDGLTDFEEFFLKSDPTKADTDGDGIEDLEELVGYVLPHKVGGEELGLIKTLMLDADTDNDKRSDGAEAELKDIELERWVVRVRGETPYRVFSHPLVADADFDFVVDGDEFLLDPLNPTRHSDPHNGNTDGDRRDDGIEVEAGTDPLAVDLRVTVIAETVETSAPGQYNFAIRVRPPDPAGVGGLSDTPLTVFENLVGSSRNVGKVKHDQNGVYRAGVWYRWFDTVSQTWKETSSESDIDVNTSRTSDPGAKGVPAGARFEVRLSICCTGTSLEVLPSQEFIYTPSSPAVAIFESSDIVTSADFDFRGIEVPVGNPADRPLASRSTSFGLAAGERFGIEGYVTGITTSATQTVKLGGLEGDKALQEGTGDTPTKVRPVFSLAEVEDKYLEEFYFQAVVNGATVKIRFFYLIE